ncbi:hypothetical protein V8C40DRAFT_242134 [Trichoderma camerunense]
MTLPYVVVTFWLCFILFPAKSAGPRFVRVRLKRHLLASHRIVSYCIASAPSAAAGDSAGDWPEPPDKERPPATSYASAG